MAVANGPAGPVLGRTTFSEHFRACTCAGDQLTGVCSAGLGDAATAAATAVCHSHTSANHNRRSGLNTTLRNGRCSLEAGLRPHLSTRPLQKCLLRPWVCIELFPS